MFDAPARRPKRARAVVLAIAIAACAFVLTSLVGGTERLAGAALTDEPIGSFEGMRYEVLMENADLTPRSRSEAVAAAGADAAVARWMREGRARAVQARPYGPFARGDVPESDPCRDLACINVTLYRYTDDAVLEAFVTPGGRVVGLRTGAGQPSLSATERAEAHRLAHADLRARVLRVAGHTHPGLAKPMWPDSGPCTLHRCAAVIFALDGMADSGIGRQLNVIVDLSHRRVVERTKIRCNPECHRGWAEG